MTTTIAGWFTPISRTTTACVWHVCRRSDGVSGCGRWRHVAGEDAATLPTLPDGAVVCKVCAQVAAKAAPAPDLLASLATTPAPVGDARLDPWKLRLARELRGLTQVQLAELAGYKGGATRLCRIERYTDEDAGVQHGKPVAFRWAKALRLTADDLCSDDVTIVANRAKHDAWRASDLSLREWARKQVQS